MDIVGVIETQMIENGFLRRGKYEMFYKGKKKQQTRGGRVGVIVRMEAGYNVEEISVILAGGNKCGGSKCYTCCEDQVCNN
jgi:hypothetical protein